MMKRTKKAGQIRRRLMAGFFCISLLAADLATVLPAWAQETPMAAEQTQSLGENGTGETQEPDGGNSEGVVENPDGDPAQESDDGKEGSNGQEPDVSEDGDDRQNPADEEDGDEVTEDTEDEADVPDKDETPEEEEKDSVSDNSVSENDVKVMGEVRALAVPADAIDSGTYENITWVVDKDGKLTVEGTGDFANPDTSAAGAPNRAPWCEKWNTYYAIKSADIKVTGMTDASYMFHSCSNLKEVNLDEFDTSTVTNMRGMFSGCGKLESINFGQRFSTNKVTNMKGMFQNCSKLRDMDISDFDTSNVTDMSYLFCRCYNWGNMNLSGWDTAKVTDMRHMFENCGFSRITLGGRFTTRAVTNMDRMFEYDSTVSQYYEYGWEDKFNLTGLDLAWLDLSSVVSMEGIFWGCNVKELNLGRLDTGVTTTLSGLFAGCDMTGVDFSNLKTDTITDMGHLFFNCTGTIDLRTLRTENVTNMSKMFARASAGNRNYLTNLDLSSLDTSNVTDMSNMFWNQIELSELNITGLDTSNVTNMAYMFAGCGKLSSIDLSGLNTGNVTQMAYMFSYCTSLKELKPGNLGTSNLIMIEDEAEATKFYPMRLMFEGCSSLESIDLSNFNFENLSVADSFGASMVFYECNKLTTIYTPYNVKYDQPIPEGDWYMADGMKLTDNCLPKNLPYSVLIQKGSKPTVSAARMEVSKKKTLYGCGETIGTDDLTVTYYGADGSVRKLAQSDGQKDGYTTNAAFLSTTEPGTLELEVSYTKDGKTLTGKVTLTVAHILTAANTTVTLPSESSYNYTYDGTPKTPQPLTVTYAKPAADGTETPVTLKEGIDYTVSYRNNVNAYEASGTDGAEGGSGAAGGNAGTEGGTDTASDASGSTSAPTVIIRGTGNYSGIAAQSFMIHKADAPAAESMNVTASQCTQAQSNRKTDLTGSFAASGKKTGYEVVSVEDADSIFSKTPVTADIEDGILTYGTNVAQENVTASIKIRVSFQNYKDADLTVKITMVSKKTAVISGIVMQDSVVYSSVPVSYSGEAVVKTADGTDITGKVTLVYRYSGVMADGTPYPAQVGTAAGNTAGGAAENGAPDGNEAGQGSGNMTAEAPVNAGSYALTVSVREDDSDYVGSAEYPFTIAQADAAVRAKDIIVLMQAGGTLVVGADGVGTAGSGAHYAFAHETTGLLNGDVLTKEPSYTVTEDEAGAKSVTAIDTSKAGVYYIHPSAADAGMNYTLTYAPGVLIVSEERVAYTVTFDGMGRCDSFTKSGVKSGALLELADSERTPAAKEQGYVFAGWYQDRTFAKGKEWHFDMDTVQSDLTLYACWLTAAAENGDGLKLCVQEIPDLTYTGSAQKPSVTVYDSDGKTALKAGKDYTIKYVRNTDAVAVGEDGQPAAAGGTAKVTDPGKTTENITDVTGHFSKDCPYVVITGKGNYTETVYRNFHILPARIAAEENGGTVSGNPAGQTGDTPLAAGFTLKYTDQFEAKANKTAKIITSFKYKKALKADQDYTVSVQDEKGAEVALVQGKLPLNAGNYALTVTGKGNYTGVVRRNLYVADKQKLMKNASISYAKTVKAVNKEELSKGIEQTAVVVKIGGKEIDPENYEIDYAGTNHAVGTATMNVKGKNGYIGSKSVTFKITGMPFSTKTVDVKAYDSARPDDPQADAFRAAMPYTGRAVTQNSVTLTAKVTSDHPNVRNLVYGDDYTITYKNHVKKGTAAMTFTANPKSGFSGSFKKSFRISAQNLSADMFVDSDSAKKELVIVGTDERKNNTIVKWDEDAVYSGGGASLSFILKNKEGIALKQGTDYTVSYKDHKTATKESAEAAVKAGSKQPVMTIKGKGNYAGSLTVQFQIIPASITSGQLNVTASQVQKKNGMKLKDFKIKIMDGKTTLKADRDYTVDDTACTPEIIKAYADSLGTTGTAPEPKLVLTGIGNYGAKTAGGEAAGGKREISLADYIYTTKLTAKNLKVEVTGDRTYTGQNIEPTVKVSYYKDNNAAKQDAIGVELTNGTDYRITYGGENIPAGKKKGSITIIGAGSYGGSVTVKFDIEKKQIY